MSKSISVNRKAATFLTILASTSLFGIAACSRYAGSGVSESGVDSATQAVAAENAQSGIVNKQAPACQLFVDKAVPEYIENSRTNEASLTLRLYLKLALNQLDAAPRSVQFSGRPSNCPDCEQFSISAQRFLGAADYWEVDLQRGLKGAFYVETEAGTRYWLNADATAFKPFVIDDRMRADLEHAVGYAGSKPGHSFVELDVAKLPKTADAFHYLNPRQCR